MAVHSYLTEEDVEEAIAAVRAELAASAPADEPKVPFDSRPLNRPSNAAAQSSLGAEVVGQGLANFRSMKHQHLCPVPLRVDMSAVVSDLRRHFLGLDPFRVF